MKDGYIRIAAVTPDLKVADVTYNISKICENIRTCAAAGAKVIVFPELCMTGYSCGDLFLQELLIERAMSGLSEIAAYTKETDAIVFVGLPVSYKGCRISVSTEIMEFILMDQTDITTGTFLRVLHKITCL